LIHLMKTATSTGNPAHFNPSYSRRGRGGVGAALRRRQPRDLSPEPGIPVAGKSPHSRHRGWWRHRRSWRRRRDGLAQTESQDRQDCQDRGLTKNDGSYRCPAVFDAVVFMRWCRWFNDGCPTSLPVRNHSRARRCPVGRRLAPTRSPPAQACCRHARR